MAKIFVGNLNSNEAREADLRALFEKCGKVLSVVIKLGFAFVEFANDADADEAIRTLHMHTLFGKDMKLSRAHTNADRSRGDDRRRDLPRTRCNSLFVGNIVPDTTLDKLHDFFEEFGRVEQIKVLPQRNGNVGISAFVDFVDDTSAARAMEKRLVFEGRELRTDFSHRRGVDSRPPPDTTSLPERRRDDDDRYARKDAYDDRRPRAGSLEDRRPRYEVVDDRRPRHDSLEDRRPRHDAYDDRRPRSDIHEDRRPRTDPYDEPRPRYDAYADDRRPRADVYDDRRSRVDAYDDRRPRADAYEARRPRTPSPRRRELSPRRREPSPRRRELSPVRYREPSPRRREPSPVRYREPSPRRRSRSRSPRTRLDVVARSHDYAPRVASPLRRPVSPRGRDQSPAVRSRDRW